MKRKWLAIAVKAAISVLLIWYLLNRVDVGQVVARARQLHGIDALLCLVVLAVQIGLVTLRWWLVARVTQAKLGLRAAFDILMIGLFFNQTLPSSVGGDAVRVWLVTREGVTLGKSFNVVLCDRVLGLVLLIAVIGASLPKLYARIDDLTIRTVLSAIVVGGAVALALFLIVGERLVRLLDRWRITRPFGKLANDFRRLFTQAGPMVVLIGLSIAVHLLTVITVALLAWGVEIQVDVVDCLIVVPTVILILTLPISIAGWGVREGAMVAGFGLVGVAADDALALSVLYGLATLLIALPGGLVWLIDRPRGATPVDLAAPVDR